METTTTPIRKRNKPRSGSGSAPSLAAAPSRRRAPRSASANIHVVRLRRVDGHRAGRRHVGVVWRVGDGDHRRRDGRVHVARRRDTHHGTDGHRRHDQGLLGDVQLRLGRLQVDLVQEFLSFLLEVNVVQLPPSLFSLFLLLKTDELGQTRGRVAIVSRVTFALGSL